MRLTAVQGDITKQEVDAIVNAANGRMRGGGGVDGAIHRAGGMAVLQDCIDRFPEGLPVGDAGWTTAGDLTARWVIHTIGPNYAAGQQDPALLESCYRRALQVADELGARTVAFPLVSAGIYGWPEREAVRIAVQTIAAAQTNVEEVRIVAFSKELLGLVEQELALETPFKILQAVRLLHERGHHSLRVLPGASPSGVHWRVALSSSDNFTTSTGYLRLDDFEAALHYTTANLTRYAGGEVTLTTPVEDVADLIVAALPGVPASADDPEYVRWYAGLLELCERRRRLPIAYSDMPNPPPGWQVGWGDGSSYPAPPTSREHAQDG